MSCSLPHTTDNLQQVTEIFLGLLSGRFADTLVK